MKSVCHKVCFKEKHPKLFAIDKINPNKSIHQSFIIYFGVVKPKNTLTNKLKQLDGDR